MKYGYERSEMYDSNNSLVLLVVEATKKWSMDMRDQKSMPQITHLLYFLLKLQEKVKYGYERSEMYDSNNSLVLLVVEATRKSKVCIWEIRNVWFK